MTPDRALGQLVRRRREALIMTQVELARLLHWPQVKVSRTEVGSRSATLQDLLSLAKALSAPLDELLKELQEMLGKVQGESRPPASLPAPYGVPGWSEAELTEEAVLAQLECYGVKFLGKASLPAVVKMPLEDVLVAALRFATEPRLFLALPVVLVRHAATLDWARVVSVAVLRQLQNRLGVLVAAALQLKDEAKDVPAAAWATLTAVHERLEDARLDRVEYLGAPPRSALEREHLSQRTPPWLAEWHVLGHVRKESLASQL